MLYERYVIKLFHLIIKINYSSCWRQFINLIASPFQEFIIVSIFAFLLKRNKVQVQVGEYVVKLFHNVFRYSVGDYVKINHP